MMKRHATKPSGASLCTNHTVSYGGAVAGNDPAYVTCKACLKALATRPNMMTLRELNGYWTAYSGNQPVVSFASWEDAYPAYKAAAAKLHGGCVA